MRRFMEEYEFLILPVNQVLPFDVNTRYPAEIAGVKMEDYIAWMKSTYYISIVGNPALAVPARFPKVACRSESRSSDAATTTGRSATRLRLRASDEYWRKTPRSCVACVHLHFERETAGALRRFQYNIRR